MCSPFNLNPINNHTNYLFPIFDMNIYLFTFINKVRKIHIGTLLINGLIITLRKVYKIITIIQVLIQ